MKQIRKVIVLLMAIIMTCTLFGSTVNAAAKIKSSDYRKISSIKDGSLSYLVESNKYAVFANRFDKNEKASYTVLYTKDMKNFKSFDFTKKTGVKFDTYSGIDSAYYINNKFYFFVYANVKYIEYYETSDFVKFTKRRIVKNSTYQDVGAFKLFRSGKYYYVTFYKGNSENDYEVEWMVYRSKDMKTWSKVTVPKSFMKPYKDDYKCDIAAFGDPMKIGKSGNTVLVNFQNSSHTKVISYKTNDFQTFTKVASNTGKQGTNEYSSQFIKMKSANKGVHIIYDYLRSSLTVTAGSGLDTKYKKIITLNNVQTYGSFVNSNSKQNSKEQIGIVTEDINGKRSVYIMDAKLTSMKRYSTKIDPRYVEELDCIGDTYMCVGYQQKLYVSNRKDTFAKYKTLSAPINVRQVGTFKGMVYLIGDVMKNGKYEGDYVYTIKQTTLEKAVK